MGRTALEVLGVVGQAYTPLIATYDKGQAPQQGGWLHVPGAYRLLANLLSLGKTAS